MKSRFIRLELSPNTWLTACERCREVVAFTDDEDVLFAAEDGHSCPRDQRSKEDETAA